MLLSFSWKLKKITYFLPTLFIIDKGQFWGWLVTNQTCIVTYRERACLGGQAWLGTI